MPVFPRILLFLIPALILLPQAGFADLKPSSTKDQNSLKNNSAIYQLKKTMLDMATAAVAMEEYAVDHNQYPKAPAGTLVKITDIRNQLEPKYINSIPHTDCWGNPLYYQTCDDRSSYYIVSFGKDGIMDKPLNLVEERTRTRKLKRDIVFRDGWFIQCPKVIDWGKINREALRKFDGR
jgi:hypothetical protein